MSVIIIPRKHFRMPQGRVRVSDEWLDTGLGAVILPRYGARNLVTGIAGVGGRSQRAGQYGVAARCTVASDAADVGISAVGTRAFTWLTVSKFDAPTASWMGLAAAKRGTEHLWAVMRNANQSPTLFYRLWSGSAHGAQTSLLLSAFGTGGLETISAASAGVIGFSIDATAGTGANQTVLRQYRDGVETTTTNITVSQAGTFDLSAAGSFFRAGGNHDGPYGAPQYAPWPHDLWMTLYWPTVALASELAQDLQRAPYQVLAADPIRIYSFPTGPISLAINSITASNITQTGARITLGLTR